MQLTKKHTILFWASILLAQFILFFIFSKLNFLVQWFNRFYEFKKEFHQYIFSHFSFSVGDIFYLIAIVLVLFLLIKIFKSKSRKNALIQLLIFINIFYFVYQTCWGMLYFQPLLIDKLSTKEPTLQETKILALKYLEQCKKTRLLVSENENGVFEIKDITSLKQSILSQQKQIPFPFNEKKTTEIRSIKPSLFQEIMSYTGIMGYYNPFTTEAQYNANMPHTQIPFTISHETAHQLGFSREQEANFIAYLIGINSKNPDLKYSTEFYVLRSLLNALVEKNEDFVAEILNSYSEEMKRDRAFEKEFAHQYRDGILDEIFYTLNDWFLKSNQQEGSITYSYFVDLLIRYEREIKP